jgi:hypothetical protein
VSAIEELLSSTPAEHVGPAQITAAIRKLATNKDLRIFLTAICKYSKADWESMTKTCKMLYNVAQTSLLMRDDKHLFDELVKYPHIAVFVDRVAHE